MTLEKEHSPAPVLFSKSQICDFDFSNMNQVIEGFTNII